MLIREMFGLQHTDGEVGIEIEVEISDTDTLPKGYGDRMSHWKAEHDGSLRGNGVEYVLKSPVLRDNVPLVTNYLKKLFDNANVEPLDSGRAGLHVHVNVQDMTITQVMNFLCLYLVFEEALTNWCGKDRVGNLFCLRVQDAEWLINAVVAGAKEMRWKRALATDKIRYAAVNLKALSTYGSMEFRAMRSTIDPEEIQEWVGMLLAIKDASLTFKTPQEVVEAVSKRGPEVIFDDVMGRFDGLEFSYRGMMDGVRQAQAIAYARDDWGQEKSQDTAREYAFHELDDDEDEDHMHPDDDEDRDEEF